MKVNGKDISIIDLQNQANGRDVCIQTLIDFLKLQDRKVAIQINTKIIIQEQYKTTYLKDTDSVEILYFASGG